MPSHLEIIGYHALVRQKIRHAKVDVITMLALAAGFGIGGGLSGNTPVIAAALGWLIYALYNVARMVLAMREEREVRDIAHRSIATLNRISRGEPVAI